MTAFTYMPDWTINSRTEAKPLKHPMLRRSNAKVSVCVDCHRFHTLNWLLPG